MCVKKGRKDESKEQRTGLGKKNVMVDQGVNWGNGRIFAHVAKATAYGHFKSNDLLKDST